MKKTNKIKKINRKEKIDSRHLSYFRLSKELEDEISRSHKYQVKNK